MLKTVQGMLLSLVLLVLGGQTFAADPDQCGEFIVFSDGSTRTLTYVDHPPEGKSIGDQRIGRRTVKDTDDNQIGEFRWIATVVEVARSSEQKDHTQSEGVFVFPEGAIFVVRPAAPTFVSPEITDAVAGRGHYIVAGGSGVFQGAHGVAKRDRSSVDQSYAFDIRCD